MTLIVHIGRRVPKNWYRRTASKLAGLLTFQENIWQMIKQSMTLAKKKANASGKINFVMTKEYENEDMYYQLEWIKIVIQGSRESEKEEYEDTMKMYTAFSKIFKKDLPTDSVMMQHFKTKKLNNVQVEEAYKAGYGSVGEENLANKLLEMGILTHVELIDDYSSRPPVMV